MAYTPQTWTNGVSKLNAARMTVIETGIADIHNLVDAKGDLYTATAADTPARLAVGANDKLLVADSAQATGLKWASITNAMVDAAAAIALSKLAINPSPTPATTLPGSPVDGQLAILTDSLTAPTYSWLFRYDGAISGSYKWTFLGGAPKHVEGDANAVINTLTQVGASGFYYAPTTASFTIPYAGDWFVEGSVSFDINGGATGLIQAGAFAGATMGATMPGALTAVNFDYVAARDLFTGVAASTAIGFAATSGVPGTHKLRTTVAAITPARIG